MLSWSFVEGGGVASAHALREGVTGLGAPSFVSGTGVYVCACLRVCTPVAGGGGQVPSPGGECPAADPGGAPGRRESAVGSPGRPPPAPPPRRPRAEEQHLLPAAVGPPAGWKAASRGGARSATGPLGLRAQLTADSSAVLAAPAPAPVLPSRRREGPRGAGAARRRDAGRGRGSPGAGAAGGVCGPAPPVLGCRVVARGWSFITL